MNQQVDLRWVEAALAKNKFEFFVTHFWDQVSSDRFVSGYHIQALCEHLQAVAEGKIKKLMINLAIRHSKSIICSVLFPVWMWVRRPETRIITASYSKSLTTRDALRSRQLIDSPKFQELFGGTFKVSDEQNRQDYYTNNHRGHRLSVSIDSRTAGFDADLIVTDDLHDVRSRNSETERNAACDYFETALQSRLVRGGTEGVILAGHRVHDDDIYARLRAKYGDDGTWSYLILPEEYTPKFSTWHNAINWKDRRQEGDLLWGERFNAQVLQQEKKTYRHEYSCIFQQEPTTPEGSLFKKEWFKYYTQDEDAYVLGNKRFAKSKAWRIATCDTAISTAAGSDWTVCQVWDIVGGHLVLVDQLRKRLDGTKIVPTLTAFCRQHNPQFIAIEKEFCGAFVIDQLREQNVVVKGFSARNHGDKETRAVAAEIRLEQGQVWFPADKDWVSDLEVELLGFPHGTHDDQCFVAGTQITTDQGDVSIEKIRVGDLVLTRRGYRRVTASGCTGIKPTITLHTSDGRELTGTRNHPIWTEEKGWSPMEKSVSRTLLIAWNHQQKSNISGSYTADTRTPKVDRTGSTTNIMEGGRRIPNIFTGEFGQMPTEQSHPDTTSTTGTGTLLTTTLQISNVLPPRITSGSMPREEITAPRTCDATWKRSAHSQPNGTSQKPVGSGTSSTVEKYGTHDRQLITCVQFVTKLFKAETHQSHNTVLTSVDSVTDSDTKKVARISTKPVWGAEKTSAHRNTDPDCVVRADASGITVKVPSNKQQKCVAAAEFNSRELQNIAVHNVNDRCNIESSRGIPESVCGAEKTTRPAARELPFVPSSVVSVTTGRTEPVYNLTVDGDQEYFANGILVHNCDTLSSACLIANKYKQTAEPDLTPEETIAKIQKEKADRFRQMLWAGAPF